MRDNYISGRWISDAIGYQEFIDSTGTAVQRRREIQVIGATFADDGNKTIMTVAGGGGSTGAAGATGPQGATGLRGATGVQGATGIQGVQGATGPIGATGIQGPTGATGPRGNTGADGITGPRGNTGANGIQGSPGSQGSPGNTGSIGPTGAIGPTGQIGTQGVQGSPGVTGSTGPTGPRGNTGIQGVTGAQGATGLQGSPGVTGSIGPQGATGLPGVTGANGVQGAQGSPGVTGAGVQGSPGPQGIQGSPGLTGAQGVTGPQGPTGTIGAQGPTGQIGPQGIQGPTGAQGIQGIQGATGVQGIQGVTGSTGPTGPRGNTGADGVTGPRGNTGADGVTGPRGNTGIQGPTGPQGATGAQGIQGVQGPTGVQGIQGIQGVTGPIGATGVQGPTGTIGTTGPSADNAVVQRFTTAGTSNDVALNANTTTLEVDTGNSDWLITGFTGGFAGRRLWVRNASNSSSRGGFQASIGSSAGNQINLPGSGIRAGHRYSAIFEYDGVDSLWRLIGESSPPQWTQLEESATGAFNDYARPTDEHHLMFVGTGPTRVLTGVAAALGFGEALLVSYQGASGGVQLNDNDVASTASNRFANYADKNIRLRDDEGALFYPVDITSGGTTDQRWLNVSHRYPFCVTTDMVQGNQIQYNGSDWVAQDFINLVERASAPTIPAGQGGIWVRNDTPNTLMFTDDGGNTYPLSPLVVASLTTRATTAPIPVTASAQTVVTYTIPANTLRAGSSYRIKIGVQVARGATSTATNIVADVLVDGTARHTLTTAGLNATNGYTGCVWLEAIFSLLAAPGATAAASVCGASTHTVVSAVGVADCPAPNITFLVDTTGSVVLRARISASASIANTACTPVLGLIERLN